MCEGYLALIDTFDASRVDFPQETQNGTCGYIIV